MTHSPSGLLNLSSVSSLLRGRVPGQLIIQVTDACNARCPQCEMRVTNRYQRAEVAEDDVLRSLDAAAQRGVAAVSFTGGEPFLDFERLLAWLQRAGDLGIPLIRTGTNGFFLRHWQHPSFEERVHRMAEQLAATRLRNLWFSIDSADTGVHETMRGLPGVIEGMARALPIFHQHGIWPTANLGINRNTGTRPLRLADGASEDARQAFHGECLEAFSGFYEKVLGMGFTIVNFCYPMSVESAPEPGLLAVYRASSADDVVSFRQEEKELLFQAMADAVAAYRHRIRIFSPRNVLYSLVEQYRNGEPHGYACRGGLDFFFVSAADGNTYPCGFRAEENLGKFWQLDPRRQPDTSCTRCDWECFRDPSNLLGPFLELGQDPLGLVRRFRRDPAWVRLWTGDLRYQRACDYFDGRRPPDPRRLARFAPA